MKFQSPFRTVFCVVFFVFNFFTVIASETYSDKSASFVKSDRLTNGLRFPDTINNLVLKIVTEHSRQLLRISLVSYEPGEGVLNIFDNAGKQVIEASFELIRTPYYATVDISTLSAGKYVVKLHTDKNIYTSEILID